MPSDLLGLNLAAEKLEIGMIDTAIDTEHEAFEHSNIQQQSFVSDGKKEPKIHGTQIAGILVGKSKQYSGLIPNSRLLGASVFFRRKGKGNIATTESLLLALNWLAEQKVKVINMSLSGPPNRLLEFAVNELCRQNIAIVAAVGNAGPLSKPLYPAGYECTIAVTAVDGNNRIYKNAVIGPHVDLAAFGVDLKTPTIKQQYSNASGTSMATAFVSAYIAAKGLQSPQHQTPLETWLSNLYKTCQDLGVKGRDPVYGHGLLPSS
jgi:subtilisin family serine protease